MSPSQKGCRGSSGCQAVVRSSSRPLAEDFLRGCSRSHLFGLLTGDSGAEKPIWRTLFLGSGYLHAGREVAKSCPSLACSCLAHETTLHQMTEPRVRPEGTWRLRSPQNLASLLPKGKDGCLGRTDLQAIKPFLSSAFLSLVADLYQHPQGKTILFPQQNRLCTSGLGINHQPRG